MREITKIKREIKKYDLMLQNEHERLLILKNEAKNKFQQYKKLAPVFCAFLFGNYIAFGYFSKPINWSFITRYLFTTRLVTNLSQKFLNEFTNS